MNLKEELNKLREKHIVDIDTLKLDFSKYQEKLKAMEQEKALEIQEQEKTLITLYNKDYNDLIDKADKLLK